MRLRKYVDQNGLAAMLATDFPDWKKFSKISLISLIGGNPIVDKFGKSGILKSLFFVQNINQYISEVYSMKSALFKGG